MSAPTEGRPVADSQVVFTRQMTQLDANLLGSVHGGVIMREVDSAAGTAAARHTGQVCVTAAIDELSFLQPVHVGDVLVVHASVNAVGKSSVEVGVRVEAESWQGGPRRHTTSAYLVMVAIDADGHAITSGLPPLIATTPQEHRRQAQAELRRALRKERIERLGSYRPELADPQD